MTRAFLIRHGEPEAAANQRCYGALEVGLSHAGKMQIARVAHHLSNEPIAAIYSSPRSRSLESAQILAAASGGTPEIVVALAEINFGDFEGLTYDEIAERFPDLYHQWMTTPTKIQFPNGESFAQMQRRVTEAFEKLMVTHKNQTIAVVSHGGVNRILIAAALEMPDHCLFRLAQSYAAVNLLEFVDGIPSLKSMNFSPA